jgi:L-ascorbate metabolism protein UlaG (beta-lactamase superfamily)
MPFQNLAPFNSSFGAVFKWALMRKMAPWPKWRDYAQAPAPPERVPGASLRLTFINHATVLIQTAGLNILTDPVYSKRCSPLQFAGPARVHAPGLAFENLPPLDLVLLSHNHYDHMDIPTLLRLAQAHPGCKIVTGLKVSDNLPRLLHPRLVELDWWQSAELGLTLHFVPEQHFSARGFGDRFQTLWGGFVIESPFGRIYFPGDTAYGRHFGLTRERYGSMKMAIMPIGAYAPRWFMKEVHMTPEESVQAFLDLGCERALAVHWGCFQLTEEPIDEPMERLAAALAAEKIPAERFRVIDPGQSWEL